jgi:hypothetical protein|tara:strand:- start:147 stop:305 length:159 start_codon:yes stop_codon:yes gene_type:complete
MEIMQLANIATAVISVASIIAALTPTPKDDALLSRFYKVLEALAFNIGKAKQ